MCDPSVHLVFDLDDTLYNEVDYARSALAFAGGLIEASFQLENAASSLLETFDNGQHDAIGALWKTHALPPAARSDVIAAMRGHQPTIDLPPDSVEALTGLETQGIKWSLLTDGRSLTQRLKIEALRLTNYSGVYISEEREVRKPELKAYSQIADDQPDACKFWYIADNPAKDFVVPNALGWNTIMVRDRGQNIHPQNLNVPEPFRAKVEISCLAEILSLVQSY
jgi:putative hydrolase of the HAD superfamily